MYIVRNDNYFFLLLTTFWIVTTLVYSFFNIIGYHELNNIILIVSSLLFIYTFYKARCDNFIIVILLYVLLRLLFLVILLVDYDFFLHIMYIGDSFNYHIPRITELTIENFIPYLFDIKNYASMTGKVTHVLYALPYNFFKHLANIYSNNEILNVSIIVYVTNTVLFVAVSVYLKNTLEKIKIEKKYIVYAVSLILFSPFILTWSSFVVKETIHILLIIISVIAILRKSYFLLLLIAIIFFIDRMYMLYYIFFLFFLSQNVNIKFKILIIIFFLSLLLVLPLDRYLSQFLYIMTSYEDSVGSGDSLVSNSNYFFDFLRVLFSPFFLSAFKVKFYEYNIFFREHITVSLLYTYFFIKILLIKRNSFSKLLLFILIINFLLFSDYARQKLTIIIPLLSIVYAMYKSSIYQKTDFNKYWKI